MAKIQNPILFSKQFGIDATVLEEEGLIDTFLNVDTQLFIDPVLLEKSSNETISGKALQSFRKHFENYVRLLAISENEKDAPWKAAEKLLDLGEPAENGLGYGGSSRSGSSRPTEIRDAMMRTSQQIIKLGAKDPEMISLMGFFEENVGPDTISDFTTKAIINALAEITEKFCTKHNIPVYSSSASTKFKLPRYIGHNKKHSFVVLVPKDIVRELPVANDWSGIEQAAFLNVQIRNRVNAYLAGIAKPTVTDRKGALRQAALESADSFQHFLETVKENAECYDPDIDALGYYKLQRLFSQKFEGLKQETSYDISLGSDALYKLVLDTVHFFKLHVEKKNLWEELWLDGKPKRERAAQLIYYAIADAFCKANDTDISPEADMGGGPVDFKFSKGYRARVLIEMKRSGGTVRHGYEKQLEIYKESAETQYGIFVVLDFGDMKNKLRQIKSIQKARLDRGESASEIIVIDARRKASASKRK